jgi:hypothetical protein
MCFGGYPVRWIKYAAVLLVALGLVAPLTAAHADDLSDAFLAVMQNPTDAGANLRYAKLAEEHGKPRLALATYERVLLNDPTNEEARRGLQRLRRELQPSSTQFKAEIGASWESNPANVSNGAKSEPGIFGSLSVRDERSAGSFGWRTTGALAGDFINNMSQLNYLYLGAGTGPVIDVTPGLSLYPALGVGAAQLDHKLYYKEATFGTTLEGLFGGAYETFRLRGGVRHYGSFFTADKGYYADASAKFAMPHIFNDRDLFVASPWLRWSGINGGVTTLNLDEIQPGRYREFGTGVDYYMSVLNDLVLGTGVTAHERYYSSVLASGSKRQDTYIAPEASVTLKDALLFQSDIKLDYAYKINRSNADTGDYHDNVVSLSFIYQF